MNRDPRLRVVAAMLVMLAALVAVAILTSGVALGAPRCGTPRDVPSWDHLARIETGYSWRSEAAARAAETDLVHIAGRWYGPPRWHYRGRYAGGLQFTRSSWRAMRACAGVTAATAADASPADQVAVARHLLAVQGLRAWPTSTRKLGWR